MTRRALLWSALAAAAPALAGDPKADILAVYERAEALFKKKDLAGLRSLLTADCTFQGVDGKKFTGDAWLARLKKVYQTTVGPIRYRTAVRDLQVRGEKATVYARQAVAMKVKDADGKVHTVTMDEISIDTLVRTPSGWKMSASVTKGSTSTLDGKTITNAR